MTLSGIRYRGATLTVSLHGAGSTVASMRIDGVPASARSVPSTLTGTHTVDVTLSNATAAQHWYLPA